MKSANPKPKLAKDEGKWVQNNPIRAERAVPLADSEPRKQDPVRGRAIGDRVVVSPLGRDLPGEIVGVFRKPRSVVIRADDPEVPPITVYDGKHIRDSS